MLVHRLRKFIEELSSTEQDGAPCDVALLKWLEEFIKNKSDNDTLIKEELVEIETLFANRWPIIKDTEWDYTISSDDEVNALWIDLAESLAEDLDKPCLHILIPDLTNHEDPDSLSSEGLSRQCSTLYISDDGKTWHDIFVIYQKTIANPSDLSLRENKTNITSRPLSLRELSRIHQKYTCVELSHGKKISFWDHLMSDIAPKWVNKGRLRPRIIPYLLDLVEKYSQYKEHPELKKGLEQSIDALSSVLQASSSEDVCFLYGQMIDCDGQKIYLLDILMSCVLNEDDLTDHLKALAKWIYHIDSHDVSKSKLLPTLGHANTHVRYFDILHLDQVLDELPIEFSPSLYAHIEDFTSTYAEKKHINQDILYKLSYVFKMPWSEMVDSEGGKLPKPSSTITSSPVNSFLSSSPRLFRNMPKTVDLSLRPRGEAFLFDEAILQIASQDVWKFLTHKLAKNLSTTGKLPRHILPKLLEVVESYYEYPENDEELSKRFKTSLIILLDSILSSPLEDVNFLYAMVLTHEHKTIYLLEVIIDCLRGDPLLSEKLPILAKWLCGIDGSLIVKNNSLDPLYESLAVGKFFNISSLQILLDKLMESTSPALNRALDALKIKASQTSEISDEILGDIKTLYALRWTIIKDTPDDYMRLRDEHNKPWFTLAQCLAGSGLIARNYYRLLIPTLTHDDDFVTKEPLTDISLKHYILSEKEDELISLQSCVSHFDSYRTFYNCNHPVSEPLTVQERNRLMYAPEYYLDYFNRSQQAEINNGLSIATVEALKELINESVYKNGFVLGKEKEISDEENHRLNNAYDKFMKYVKNLPKEEQLDLYCQYILLYGKKFTFLEVLKEIVDKWQCAATNGQYIMKLIIDYDPSYTFKPEIELKVNADTWRRCSARKLYREYELLSEQEALRRILVIVSSLMTYHFGTFVLTGNTIVVGDCENVVSKTGAAIFDKVKEGLFSGKFDNPKVMYSELIEKVIKPALKDHSYISGFTRSKETIDWLKGIVEGTPFKNKQQRYFEPKLIFTTLFRYLESNPKNRVVNVFLDEILTIMNSVESEYSKWVRINAKLHKLFERLPKESQSFFINALQRSSNITQIEFFKSVLSYIICLQVSPLGKPSFAGVLFPRKDTPKEALPQLEQALISDQTDLNISVRDFIEKFKSVKLKPSIGRCMQQKSEPIAIDVRQNSIDFSYS